MFGTTHTKRRNRISPQKVHNSSVVRLDSNRIFRGDKARRKKRRFDAQEGVGGSRQQGGSSEVNEDVAALAQARESGEDEGDGNDTTSFRSMADALIQAANEAEGGIEDPEEDLPTFAAIDASVPRHSELQTQTTPAPASSSLDEAISTRYRRIKMKDLFNYNLEAQGDTSLKFYWDIGRDLAAQELEVLDAAAGQRTS